MLSSLEMDESECDGELSCSLVLVPAMSAPTLAHRGWCAQALRLSRDWTFKMADPGCYYVDARMTRTFQGLQVCSEGDRRR